MDGGEGLTEVGTGRGVGVVVGEPLTSSGVLGTLLDKRLIQSIASTSSQVCAKPESIASRLKIKIGFKKLE